MFKWQVRWTRLVIGPERGVRVVGGILTGWHEPDASHLLMLEAVGGRVRLHAHRGPLPPADADQADTGELRDLLCQARIGQILHLHQGQRLRG